MSSLDELLLFCILPLLVANIVHHFIILRYELFSALAKPIDGGAVLLNKRVFGDHKTWRGLILVPAMAGFIGLSLAIFISKSYAPALISLGSGLAYMLGELPNSFLKRRANIAPGKFGSGFRGSLFRMIDQVDSVIAVAAFLLIATSVSPYTVLFLAGIGVVAHITLDRILISRGYKYHRLQQEDG